MKRRTFLGVVSGCAGLALVGCKEPPTPALAEVTRLTLDPATGATLAQANLRLPEQKWSAQPPGQAGMIYAYKDHVLLLGASNDEATVVPSASLALWPAPTEVYTGQKVSGRDFEVRGVELPSARARWSAKIGYARLLGVTQQAVVVADEGGLWAFDRKSGQQLWHNQELQGLVNCASLGPETVVASYADSGQMVWVDVKSGQTVRKVMTNGDGTPLELLVASRDWTLALVKRKMLQAYLPGQEKPAWTMAISSEEYGTELLAVEGSEVLLRMQNVTVAVDTAIAKPLWKEVPFERACVHGEFLLLMRPRIGPDGKPGFILDGRERMTGKPLWRRFSSGQLLNAMSTDKGFVVVDRSFTELESAPPSAG